MSKARPRKPSGTTGQAGGTPDIVAAEEAVERAREELARALDHWEKVRQMTEPGDPARKGSLGDLVEMTLEMVRQHPGPGVVIASLLGFMVGKSLRK